MQQWGQNRIACAGDTVLEDAELASRSILVLAGCQVLASMFTTGVLMTDGCEPRYCTHFVDEKTET